MKRHQEGDRDDHGKRGKGDKGGGKHSKGKDKGTGIISTNGLGTVRRHAFKVLCADPLAANLIGKSGSTRAQIEQETGASVWISKRDELFPNPPFRLLILHADEPRQIMDAVEAIVPKIVEVGDRDRELGELESPLLGKAGGEYVFHCALPAMIRGKLIGSKGVNIQALREKTGCKVFVENNAYNGHLATRIIGTPDNMRHVLQLLNEAVVEVADSEEFHQWVNSQPQAEGKGQDTRRRDPPRERDRERSREPRRDRDRQDRDRHDSRRGYRSRSPAHTETKLAVRDQGQEEPPRGRHEEHHDDHVDQGPGLLRDPRFSPLEEMPDLPPLECIGELVRQLPTGSADMDHQFSCELQTDSLMAVMDDETQRYIEQRTSATIALKDAPGDDGAAFTSIMFTGPVLSTYFAHFLLMQRVHEHRRAQEEEEAATGEAQDVDVAELKAQVARLQAQLENRTGKGKGGGGGGKQRGGGRR